MLRNNKQRTRPIAEMNVVPYIDVMLVLLVIFMITAPILTQGVTVDLPKALSESIQSDDREPVIVSVNREGQYFLNVHSAPDQPLEPKALMTRVAAELIIAQQSGEKSSVFVKGDQGVSYGKVMAAMSLLKQAGAEQVGLLTDASGLDEDRAA